MKILSIDTSCDETAVAVTEGTKILSNIIWSQASDHAKFGGIMPTLAKRMHEERIDFVIEKAIHDSRYNRLNGVTIHDLDAIAVTIGPGLSIALRVGVEKAKELAIKYNKKLIAVNHLEGHLLSCLAQQGIRGNEPEIMDLESSKTLIHASRFPSLGLVVSGGNTQLILIKEIGKYEILAQTTDDALGEALDKAARMLGLGYPGGAILEKMAKLGDPKIYDLPIPLVGHEDRMEFTYSGLKSAMMRLIEKEKPLSKEKIYNLAASFQNVAFAHLIRVISFVIHDSRFKIHDLLVGGGVAANVELRKRLRKLGKENGITVHFPTSNKLYGDNAAMIGVAAYFKAERGEFSDPNKIDRDPGAKL